MKLSPNEKKVLEYLRINARQTETKIASALGIHQSTVSRTIRSLEQRQLLIGYTIVEDISKYGN